MIIQSEAFTIDVTRYEIDILRRAIKDLYQLIEFEEDDSKDKEITEHLLIKLEDALRLR
jgi:hypothetical protein